PSVRGAATYADLGYHHLREVWSQLSDSADRVILVVPGDYSREQLSLLLGIARECEMPVSGLVDQAVVAAEQPAPGRQLFHLDLMSQRAVLTGLVQGSRLRRDNVSSVDQAGSDNFYDAWANAIGDAFVRNTRFDPMHAAESEQRLYDRLPDWISEISRSGQAELSLPNGGREHTVVLTAKALVAAAQPLYRKITRHISASGTPGQSLTLMIADRIQDFPGLREALTDGLQNCELIELAHAQAGSGAIRRQEEIVSSGENVAFVTSVTWRGSIATLPLPGEPRPDRTVPTHVLYRGRGWAIGDNVLYLGSQPHNGEQSIVLTGDLAGVSNDHCRIARRGNEVVVEDRSQHGTFLNDRRIEGTAEAQYGDVLRLGGAEQVLQLITIPDGA
ncbi:MAG: FHA domain-containing protein, partial [Gammaproteobacteria bacterium]|nr:FHA domain-containing protein [Gammaproteobacteria bacterium]